MAKSLILHVLHRFLCIAESIFPLAVIFSFEFSCPDWMEDLLNWKPFCMVAMATGVAVVANGNSALYGLFLPYWIRQCISQCSQHFTPSVHPLSWKCRHLPQPACWPSTQNFWPFPQCTWFACAQAMRQFKAAPSAAILSPQSKRYEIYCSLST